MNHWLGRSRAMERGLWAPKLCLGTPLPYKGTRIQKSKAQGLWLTSVLLTSSLYHSFTCIFVYIFVPQLSEQNNPFSTLVPVHPNALKILPGKASLKAQFTWVCFGFPSRPGSCWPASSNSIQDTAEPIYFSRNTYQPQKGAAVALWREQENEVRPWPEEPSATVVLPSFTGVEVKWCWTAFREGIRDHAQKVD